MIFIIQGRQLRNVTEFVISENVGNRQNLLIIQGDFKRRNYNVEIRKTRICNWEVTSHPDNLTSIFNVQVLNYSLNLSKFKIYFYSHLLERE